MGCGMNTLLASLFLGHTWSEALGHHTRFLENEELKLKVIQAKRGLSPEEFKGWFDYNRDRLPRL